MAVGFAISRAMQSQFSGNFPPYWYALVPLPRRSKQCRVALPMDLPVAYNSKVVFRLVNYALLLLSLH